MRLICPNCDAQYELAEGAIPTEGRDVQCSNCGHAWFQQSLELEAARLAEENLFELPDDTSTLEDDNFEAELAASLAGPAVDLAPDVITEPAPEPEPEQVAPMAEPVVPEPPVEMPAAEPVLAQAPVAVFDAGEDEDVADLPLQFDAPTPLPRRTMDESLIAVLREEAEREARVRSAEPPRGLETQTELGLEAMAISPAARRIAQMKGIDPDAQPPEPPRPQTRLEMLPDIEEINSTLRPSSERGSGRDATPEMEPVPSKSGFRSGFVLMMILAVLLVVFYIMAPRIAEQIPGAAASMKAYVAMVDGARLFVDGVLQKIIQALQS